MALAKLKEIICILKNTFVYIKNFLIYLKDIFNKSLLCGINTYKIFTK